MQEWVGSLGFLPEQGCCGAVEGSCRPLVQLCPHPATLLSGCVIKKAGQGPWHQAYGLALIGAQVSLKDGLVGLMCEKGLAPKGRPRVETWPPGAQVLAQLHWGGSFPGKAVTPNTLSLMAFPRLAAAAIMCLASEPGLLACHHPPALHSHPGMSAVHLCLLESPL